MAVQVSYPGVYIQEFAPGAPIQGVGTSTGGFVGIAASGPIDTPTMVTSWNMFQSIFGAHPRPGFYLFYAVRGFFENNGQVCYIVRASNGRLATWNLTDQSSGAAPAVGQPVLQASTRQPGVSAVVITTAANHLLTDANTPLYRPKATLAVAANGGYQVTLAADGAVTPTQVAGRFRPGDQITIAGGNDIAQVISVSGAVLRLGSQLTQNYAVGAVLRLADAPSGTLTIRIEPSAALLPGVLSIGSILTVTQGANHDTKVVASVQTEPLPEGGQTYRVTFTQGLAIPLSLDPAGGAATVQSQEIDVTVKLGTINTVYARLSVDPTSPRYLVDTINNDPSGMVTMTLATPPPPGALPNSLPLGAVQQTDTGATENLADLVAQNFIDGINSFTPINDVNFIAVPDRPNATGETMLPVQQALIAHCEQMGDRFGIMDSNPGVPLYGAGSIEEQRQGLDSVSGYAALYYPWLQVLPDTGSLPILVPPCGHVAGVFARVDNNRGVYKAPANEIVAGALGVERRMSLIDLGQLNLQGIDVINVFQNGGQPVVWGARTTATNTNWQYVNIRRLFLYLEVSIQQGINWAVWEPNNLSLWQKLNRSISDFLTRAWRDGALFGAKASDAFYVRIDDVINPFSEQQLGRLHIEIGVAPTYPAEFIIVNIGIWDGGSQVTES